MVAFNLGRRRAVGGRPKAAQADLRHAKQLDPYGFYGERADNALHYNMPRGYPIVLPAELAAPQRPSVAELRVAGRGRPRRLGRLAAAGGALERAHRVEAIEAARKAVEASPTAVSPRVALAVLTFDKDHPATSMGQLGPLLQQQEGNTEIRFHVGLLVALAGADDAGAGRVPPGAPGRPARALRGAVASFIDQLDPSGE